MKQTNTHPPSAWQLQEALRVLMEGLSRLDDTPRDENDTLGTLGELLGCEATKATDVLEAVLRASVQAGDMAELAAERARVIGQRSKRYQERRDRLRDMARDAFAALGITRHEMPDMTVTVRAGHPAVRVIDQATIPDEFKSTVEEVVVDKMALARALKNGEQVPGAELSNGAPTISIRTV